MAEMLTEALRTLVMVQVTAIVMVEVARIVLQVRTVVLMAVVTILILIGRVGASMLREIAEGIVVQTTQLYNLPVAVGSFPPVECHINFFMHATGKVVDRCDNEVIT